MTRTQLVQDSEVLLVDKPEAQTSQPVKPSRELVSNGLKNTCSFTCSTQESTFQATRCLSLVLLQKMTEPTSLLILSKTHETPDRRLVNIVFTLSFFIFKFTLLTNKSQLNFISFFYFIFYQNNKNHKINRSKYLINS